MTPSMDEGRMNKTGGPAFPFSAQIRYMNDPGHARSMDFCGMTLRDWMAGMALQGIRASQNGQLYPKELVAKLAYADADAMLKQRKGQE